MKLLLAFLLAVGAWDKPEEPLPPLYLARYLPSHGRCLEGYDLAVAWESNPQNPRRPGWLFNAAERQELWKMAHWATEPTGRWINRRMALKRVLELAGARAVVTGELPPPVPLDWYTER